MMVAEAVDQEPKWPDLALNELLKLGFKDRIIDSRDHPAMQELRGNKSSKPATDRGSWL
jgi:hypothetical protein